MMNERIQKLAEQARQYAEDKQNDPLKIYTLDCFNKKFAELIVQKCANIGERYADGNYEVYNQIMAHFGLEEPEE